MTMNKLPDAELLFANLLSQIKPLINEHSALIGIHSGGAWLMQRMLNELTPAPVHGTLDVSFYRDDYHQRGLHHEPKPSHIPFDVEKRHIILIDDARLFIGENAYPTIQELRDYLSVKALNYKLEIEDDIIALTPISL